LCSSCSGWSASPSAVGRVRARIASTAGSPGRRHALTRPPRTALRRTAAMCHRQDLMRCRGAESAPRHSSNGKAPAHDGTSPRPSNDAARPSVRLRRAHSLGQGARLLVTRDPPVPAKLRWRWPT
jgi:hypothetical protein